MTSFVDSHHFYASSAHLPARCDIPNSEENTSNVVNETLPVKPAVLPVPRAKRKRISPRIDRVGEASDLTRIDNSVLDRIRIALGSDDENEDKITENNQLVDQQIQSDQQNQSDQMVQCDGLRIVEIKKEHESSHNSRRNSIDEDQNNIPNLHCEMEILNRK